MAAQSENDRIENVAPGDIVALTPEAGGEPRQYKVVHTDSRDDASGKTMIVTLEGDNGETSDVELPAHTMVERTLESKWESPQSPTPHDG